MEISYDVDKFQESARIVEKGNDPKLCSSALSLEKQITDKFAFYFLDELEIANLSQYCMRVISHGLRSGYATLSSDFFKIVWEKIYSFYTKWIKDQIKHELCDTLIDTTAEFFIYTNFQKNIEDLPLNLIDDPLVQNRSLQIYFKLLRATRAKFIKDEFITGEQRENGLEIIKKYHEQAMATVFIPIVLEKNLQPLTIDAALQWFVEGFLYHRNIDIKIFGKICNMCSNYDQHCEVILKAISSILTQQVNIVDSIIECGNIEVSQSKWVTPEYIELASILLNTMVDQFFCSEMEKCAKKCCEILTQNCIEKNLLSIATFWYNFWLEGNKSDVQNFILSQFRNYIALLCELIPSKDPNNPNYDRTIKLIGNTISSICAKYKGIPLKQFNDYRSIFVRDLQKYRVVLIAAPFVYDNYQAGVDMMMSLYQEALNAFKISKQTPHKGPEIASFILEMLRYDSIIFKNPKFAATMYMKAAALEDYTPVRPVAIHCLERLLCEDVNSFLKSVDGTSLMDSIMKSFTDHIYPASERDIIQMYKIHSKLIKLASDNKKEYWISLMVDPQKERWRNLLSPLETKIANDKLTMRSLTFEIKCIKWIAKYYGANSTINSCLPITKLCKIFAESNDQGYGHALLQYLKAITVSAFEVLEKNESNSATEVLKEIASNIELISKAFSTPMYPTIIEYLMCSQVLSAKKAVAAFRQCFEYFLLALEPSIICPHVQLPQSNLDASYIAIIGDFLRIAHSLIDSDIVNRVTAVLISNPDFRLHCELVESLFEYDTPSELAPAAAQLMYAGAASHSLDALQKKFIIFILTSAPNESAEAIRVRFQRPDSTDVILECIQALFEDSTDEENNFSKLCDFILKLYFIS